MVLLKLENKITSENAKKTFKVKYGGFRKSLVHTYKYFHFTSAFSIR